MQRRVEPEILDELPATDPRAWRSRRDLQRINRLMGNAAIIARHLRSALDGSSPRRVVELGAGDGTFLLRVARRSSRDLQNVEALLVDRQPVVSRATVEEFRALGWRAEAVQADVFDWLRENTGSRIDVIVANLFLHHFPDEQLAEMFGRIAEGTKAFMACETRRFKIGLAASRMLWLIGCNSVTRHDAVVSVRAGFTGQELSALWPKQGNWRLQEHDGLASHLFVAKQIS